jgi:serine/threonine protein kinase
MLSVDQARCHFSAVSLRCLHRVPSRFHREDPGSLRAATMSAVPRSSHRGRRAFCQACPRYQRAMPSEHHMHGHCESCAAGCVFLFLKSLWPNIDPNVSRHEPRAHNLAKTRISSCGNTCASERLGALEYMSPEQAGTASQDIDTRSHVYSLGVLRQQTERHWQPELRRCLKCTSGLCLACSCHTHETRLSTLPLVSAKGEAQGPAGLICGRKTALPNNE